MAGSSRTKQVSVLIPTYNYARYLPQAIESVLCQSFTDFELIISDDNSSDDSAEIIRRYAAHDNRIKFTLQSPNLGMVQNWNWCLEHAQGQYIKYLFGDDFLPRPDALGLFVELMEAEPGIRLAASARTVVDETSCPIDVWNHIGETGIYHGTEAIIASLRSNGNLFGEPSAVMFRQADAARRFDQGFRQVVDWEFWIHLLSTGDLAFTKEQLCAFRQHALQQTEVNRVAKGVMNEHPRLLQRYCHYLTISAEHRQKTFDHMHRLQKLREPVQSEIDLAGVLRQTLGKHYYWYLLRYKAGRPYANFRRNWQKYVQRNLPPKEKPSFIHSPGQPRPLR